MGDKGSGRRIYEKPMNTRITVRLDLKHMEIMKKIAKEKNLQTDSDVIRFVLEQFYKK